MSVIWTDREKKNRVGISCAIAHLWISTYLDHVKPQLKMIILFLVSIEATVASLELIRSYDEVQITITQHRKSDTERAHKITKVQLCPDPYIVIRQLLFFKSSCLVFWIQKIRLTNWYRIIDVKHEIVISPAVMKAKMSTSCRMYHGLSAEVECSCGAPLWRITCSVHQIACSSGSCGRSLTSERKFSIFRL